MGGWTPWCSRAEWGERAPVRAAAAAGLRFLGVEIGPTLNASLGPRQRHQRPGASVSTLVVKSHEDVEVAREVRRS